MARDPFAPVTQPTVPPWVWAVAAVFGVLIITMGTVAAVALSRRAPTPVAPAAAATVPKAAPIPTVQTASAGTPAAPDKAAGAGSADPDRADKDGDKHKAAAHHR